MLALPSSRRWLERLVLCVGAVACTWSISSEVTHAQTTIAGDIDITAPISVSGVPRGDGIGPGGGFGIRLGQELHLPFFTVNPEIGFTYASFANNGTPSVYRGIAGLRLGVGEIFRFGVMAHVGFGHVAWTVPVSESRDIDLTHTAFTYDAGVFLEFTALPILNLGGHLAYNHIANDDDSPYDPLQWISIGIHVTLVL
jgi:hypothetical protein